MLSRRGSTETQDIGAGDPEGHQAGTGGDARARRDVVGSGLGIVQVHAAHAEGFL